MYYGVYGNHSPELACPPQRFQRTAAPLVLGIMMPEPRGGLCLQSAFLGLAFPAGIVGRGPSSLRWFCLSFLLVLCGIIDMARVFQAHATRLSRGEGRELAYAATGKQELVNGSYTFLAVSRSSASASPPWWDSPSATPPQTWRSGASTTSACRPATRVGAGQYEEVEVRYSVIPITPVISAIFSHVLVTGKQRVINERFGAVPMLDRANISSNPGAFAVLYALAIAGPRPRRRQPLLRLSPRLPRPPRRRSVPSSPLPRLFRRLVRLPRPLPARRTGHSGRRHREHYTGMGRCPR